MSARQTANINTYERVKWYFAENPTGKFNLTSLASGLNVNYDSLKIIMKMLVEEKFVKKEKFLYHVYQVYQVLGGSIKT